MLGGRHAAVRRAEGAVPRAGRRSAAPAVRPGPAAGRRRRRGRTGPRHLPRCRQPGRRGGAQVLLRQGTREGPPARHRRRARRGQPAPPRRHRARRHRPGPGLWLRHRHHLGRTPHRPRRPGHRPGLPARHARPHRRSRRAGRLQNVDTLHADIEDIPLPDRSIDQIISNGVLNLCPRKARALAECRRVLRPGGKLCVADTTVEEDDLPAEVLTHPAAWTGCTAGALTEHDFARKLERAGFRRGPDRRPPACRASMTWPCTPCSRPSSSS